MSATEGEIVTIFNLSSNTELVVLMMIDTSHMGYRWPACQIQPPPWITAARELISKYQYIGPTACLGAARREI